MAYFISIKTMHFIRRIDRMCVYTNTKQCKYACMCITRVVCVVLNNFGLWDQVQVDHGKEWSICSRKIGKFEKPKQTSSCSNNF